VWPANVHCKQNHTDRTLPYIHTSTSLFFLDQPDFLRFEQQLELFVNELHDTASGRRVESYNNALSAVKLGLIFETEKLDSRADGDGQRSRRCRFLQ